MSNDPGNHRFACEVRGCGKSFIRKEHLTRHSRTHGGTLSFVCNTCSRAFNRNDVLQRHIARHSATVDASRNKRACDWCHASKVRCSGSPCTACVKKDIPCKDERDDGANNTSTTDSDSDEADMEGVMATTIGQPLQGSVAPHPVKATASATATILAADGVGLIPPVDVIVSEEINHTTAINRDELPLWLTAQAPQSPDARPRPLTALTQAVENYSELYFTRFHHRWPVIHAPTFDEKSDSPMLTSSVQMIGCWLEGSVASKQHALSVHARLMEVIWPRIIAIPLSQRSFRDVVSLYQASLLNIIFGFYTGVEGIITRVSLLRNVLVAVLREHGLFRAEIKIEEDVPGVWFPFLWARLEERKRLAVCLFEIDAYLAIHRGQPPLLNPDELHFSLLSTFTLWNAPGFPIWETRNVEEPADRSFQKIRDMNRIISVGQPTTSFVLPEDVNLGLCALQSDIWQYWETQVFDVGDDHYIKSLAHRDALHQKLQCWIVQLDANRILYFDERDKERYQKDKIIPQSYYFGLEDHSDSVWIADVSKRHDDIRKSTMTLYRLLRLLLHADLRTLRILKAEKDEDASFPNVIECQELRTKEWAGLPTARRAIWHAVCILAANSSKEINREDPVSHMALSISGLTVWGYLTYGPAESCKTCNEAGEQETVFEIPVNDGREYKFLREMQREKWFESGGMASFEGIPLCHCSLEIFMERFKICFPTDDSGWQLFSYAHAGSSSILRSEFDAGGR